VNSRDTLRTPIVAPGPLGVIFYSRFVALTAAYPCAH
jgi:hypothetical protein